MRYSYIFIILFFASLSSFAQIRVIDEVKNNISSIYSNTNRSICIDEIQDGRVKITFNADSTYLTNDYGQIYLNSLHDLDSLYQIINHIFSQNKDQTIFLSLDDNSKLVIRYHYNKFLFNNSYVILTHSYDVSPYLIKSTKKLSQKDINRLFNKM